MPVLLFPYVFSMEGFAFSVRKKGTVSPTATTMEIKSAAGAAYKIASTPPNTAGNRRISGSAQLQRAGEHPEIRKKALPGQFECFGVEEKDSKKQRRILPGFPAAPLFDPDILA